MRFLLLFVVGTVFAERVPWRPQNPRLSGTNSDIPTERAFPS